MKATRHWRSLADGRAECGLCPRACVLASGQRGFCFVRGNEGGAIVLHAYGQCSGLCVDPIEKKPLYHFLPGTQVLSFGTAGCNLGCRFCQNWNLSAARSLEAMQEASPEAIARAALRADCRSVAFTYNDPVVFHEYALDTAAACHALGLRTVAVTAGYQCAAPRAEFYAQMDGANIDLKAYSESFYQRLCGGHLQPVLETLEFVARETQTWLEVTTLLIPGENDSDAELDALTAWIAEHLGVDVPLHFSAFHPDWKLRESPPTPLATLLRARDLARRNVLRHVYIGNARSPEGEATRCANCEQLLIARDHYTVTEWSLGPGGACPRCGKVCAGIFEEGSKNIGSGPNRVCE